MSEAPEPQIPVRKRRLIEATVGLMIRQGFADTSVDEICRAAGVTKGAFFHYFSSKEEVGMAAMEAWTDGWLELLDASGLDDHPEPLDRLWALFDTMERIYLLEDVPAGCLVGTIAQEQAASNPNLRAESNKHLARWVERTAQLLADAKAASPPKVDFEVNELAWWLCSFVQGTMLLTKAHQSRALVSSNIHHCRAYVRFLFGF